MGKTNWQTKKKYNNKHYARVSADLPIPLVKAFKAKCKEENVPIAQMLKKAIEDFLRKNIEGRSDY